jgi:uncharacterized BrkB/YihY/UPF0761 family membrane protein
MINRGTLTSRADLIGGLASTLCFLHCLATPVFFAAHAGAVFAGDTHPWWWGILDLAFLAISFLAVYWSARNTTKTWIKWVFWGLWAMLALIVLNEKMGFWNLPEAAIYPPTLGLIALHFYNHRYFRCTNRDCSVHRG